MKLSILFLIIGINFSFASTTYSQNTRLSLHLKNQSITSVFKAIENQSDYVFFYQDEAIDGAKKVSIEVDNETADKVLDQVFSSTGNTYRISDRQIFVSRQNETFEATTTQQNKKIIKGLVVDVDGEPLIGVTLKVVGAPQVATITDTDGKFQIAMPARTSELEFSYIGFQVTKIKLGFGDDEKELRIVLKEAPTDLNEVVVVAYGQQKKASIVGSVQTISSRELQVPSTRLTTSFAGRLAGVVAVQRGGQPGADGANFWIRGISSFNAGSQSPLIVVDGVPSNSVELNAIDPESIDSFSVLKDATATALYGTLGANGVIIVNTKQGEKRDKAQIHVHVRSAISEPIKKPKIANGVTFMNMYNEAIHNSGAGDELMYSPEKIAGTIAGNDPLLYPNVNWYKELFKNQAFNQSALLNVRGGGDKATYFLSVSAHHETGLLKNKSKDFASYDNGINNWRYVFQNNLEVKLTNTTKVGLRLNVRLDDNNGSAVSPNDLYSHTMNTAPVDYPVLFPSGDPRNQSDLLFPNVAWGGRRAGFANAALNPVAEMAKGYQDSFTSQVRVNFDVKQDLAFITKGLSAKGLFSFTNLSSSSTTRTSGYNQYYIDSYNMGGNGLMSDYKLAGTGEEQSIVLNTKNDISGNRSMYIQGMLNYNRTFDKVHDVAAMLIYDQTEYKNSKPTDLISSLPQRKQGVAGRINYNYDNRYLAEFNFGYTGSENFAKGHRFGFFPSVAVGYYISSEKFWERIKPVISSLKIKGSWGKVGNDQIGGQRFLYLEQLDLNGLGTTTGIEQNQSMNGPKYTRFQNKNIGWEVGYKFNVGLEMELFNSLYVMVDGFTEDRENIFMQRKTVPNFLGTEKVELFGNLGKVRNRGFDVALDYHKQITPDFFLSAKGTFTYARNKILEEDEAAYLEYPNLSRVGHPINSHLVYLADRLFIDEHEIANSPKQSIGGGTKLRPGDIKYKEVPNAKGEYDGVINDRDRVYAGHPSTPEIVYGFGISANYKKWDISCFFQGVARTSILLSGFHPFSTDNVNMNKNVLDFVAKDYWSENNPNIYAKYPRLTSQRNENNTVASTYWLRNGSFLKLKNVEIGYQFKFFRLYLSGSNLLTFSKFKAWDPEQGGGAGFKYPNQRVFNLGLQMTL